MTWLTTSKGKNFYTCSKRSQFATQLSEQVQFFSFPLLHFPLSVLFLALENQSRSLFYSILTSSWPLPTASSKTSVYCACLCSIVVRNRQNGDKGTHFCTVCSWRHLWYCTQLCTQKVIEVACMKNEKKNFTEKFKLCLLSHFRTPGQLLHKVHLIVGLSVSETLRNYRSQPG